MKNQLRRLRLRDGDIVVVKDNQTAEKLMYWLRHGNSKRLPDCPIIVAPNGIGRLSTDYLKRLIARRG